MGILRPEEADSAEVALISPQATSFKLSWVALQVVPEKFVATSLDAAHNTHLLNLATSTFAKLEHTPITHMGLVWRAHYQLPSEVEWHRLGDRLAPKEPWSGLLSSSKREGGFPGLRALVVEGQRENSPAEWIRVKVEPSSKVEQGLFIEIHEHYESPEDDPSSLASATVTHEWEPFLTFSSSLAERILSMDEEA